MKLSFALLALVAVGCQNLSNRLTVVESKAFVSLAKNTALASGVLTPVEEENFDSIEPVVTYYFLSRPVADYSVRWKLSEDEELVVSGRGDIFRLENATARRRKA